MTADRLSDQRLRKIADGEVAEIADVPRMANELIALRAENERLRNALRPFADEAGEWGYRDGVVFIRGEIDDELNIATFRVEDFFRARDILKEQASE